MRFSPQIQLFVSLGCCAIVSASTTGCDSGEAKKQKALRSEVNKALRDRSYGKAAQLGERLVKLDVQDNGSWDRLVQAQFGLSDPEAVKQTLEEWRKAAKKTSPKIDEYSGDLAFAGDDLEGAVQNWTKVLGPEPKNTRILEKIAEAEKMQHHWGEEEAVWTTYIGVHDNAIAHLGRAMCRRRLHRWDDAFEDLKRAQALGAADARVQLATKVFEKTEKLLPDIREVNAALAVSPDDPGLLADRALLSLRSDDHELALDDSREAVRLGPWAVRPKLFQAIALIGLGRPNEAEALGVQKLIRLGALTPEFLQTISRLDSEISVERSNAELYVARAWQLNEIDQPTLALQDAENGARLDPKSGGACVEASYALMKLGRAEEALQQIMHATELDAHLSTAWQYRGELEMERGETMSAVESLSRSIETNQTVIALQKREICYRKLGLQLKAEEDRHTLEELNGRSAK